MNDCIIYGLRCPVTDEYMYIGKSTRGLARPRSHLYRSHNVEVNLWVADLKQKGLLPLIDVIEQCEFDELSDKEKYWIDYYSKEGSPILNIHKYVTFCDINKIKELEIIEKRTNDLLNKFSSDKGVFKLQDLPSLLKKRRKVLQINQIDLSEISGVSKMTLKRIEARKNTNTTVKTLLKLLDVLGYEAYIVLKQMQ